MIKRFAIVENGVVVNIPLAEEEFGKSMGWLDLPDAFMFDLWDGVKLTRPQIINPDQN